MSGTEELNKESGLPSPAEETKTGEDELPEADLELLLKAFQTLQEVAPIVQEVSLRKAQEKLNRILYTRFKLGGREGDQFRPCRQVEYLMKEFGLLRVPLEHQVRIIEGLAVTAEDLYTGTTRGYIAAPESTMALAAKMWIYRALATTALEKAGGKLK